MNHRFTVTAAIASAAASASLVPLMSGGKWFWGGIGAILVIALVGTATRARALRALPAAVCLLCALVALVLYLNVLFSAKSSFLGFIPTGASLTALWRSALQGLSDTQKYSPPVPPIAAIELVAVAGIGLAASVTDLIAVRLRRSALAGLPLFVLFSVPIASDAGKSALEDVIVFSLGMAGYLALLSADGRERLRLWGRLVTPWNTGRDEQTEELESGQSLRDLAASGRRIGLAAVVLALFVPLMLPSLHAHRLFQGHGNSPGLGPGSGPGIGLPDPIALMNGQLREPKPQPVLTYTTDAPSNNPQYLQVYVLNKLSTAGWSLTRTGSIFSLNGGQMPQPPGLTPKVKWPVVHTTVDFSNGFTSKTSYLPMPYPATKVGVVGNWQANTGTLMLYSLSMPLAGLQYTVTSDYIAPQPEELDAAPAATTGMSGYLTVPSAYRSLTSLARKITKGATTPGAEGAALENWFSETGGFTYSLNAPQAKGAAALREFLFKTKRGYCQQFAVAMGVLARLLGIPSRVVVGYTSGTYQGQGKWQVQTSDAHSWPQLYIKGYGWMTFEPTPPGSAPGQGTAFKPTWSLQAGNSVLPVLPVGTVGPTGSQNSHKIRNQAQPHGGPLGGNGRKGVSLDTGVGGAFSRAPVHHPPIPLIVLGSLLVIALLTPRTVRTLTGRRRWLAAHGDAGSAHAAWAETLDYLEDYGVRHGPGETPRAIVKRVTGQQRLTGPAAEALTRLAQAEERASYAREPGPSGTLATDVITVRKAVSAAVTRNARWQARLLPASAVNSTRRTLTHALDIFGWAELLLGRLTKRILTLRVRPDQG
jgi:transglutaminase-like putative cysteine protease